mgnify:CR=1 FL=1
MQCSHCAHPDYILFGKNRGAQRYRCQACQRIFQTLRRGKAPPPSKNRLKSYTSKDWGSEPLAESSGCITKLSPAGLSRLLGSYQSTNPRRRPALLLRSMNSAVLLLKKSKCWIWVALDSTFGKVLGFVCGSRSIKTARELFKQWKGLPTMGYGTDFLKTYEHLIPTALHPQGKTFTTQIESLNCRLRYYLARLHRRTLC